ncbi:MAG: peroxidase family protein [Planctomycetales bacterium]|nr:peroxidase family protein [Planctomycetales bacterium]
MSLTSCNVLRGRCTWISLLVAIIGVPTMTLSGADRTLDGTGNHLVNPLWGAASIPFTRASDFVTYDDGMSEPVVGMPNPRHLSNVLGDQPSPMADLRGLSDFVWQWGQFLDHDITLRRGGAEFMPIMVSDSVDPLRPMIPFDRSAIVPGSGTSVDNPRQQITDTTAYIDASMVYGVEANRASALRTFQGGQLAMDAFGLLPRNTGGFANDNQGPAAGETLFLAGDPRANEHVGLTSMHTLFVREHNRLAESLVAEHPSWNDEQVYQRSRKIVGATIQAITYNEYLPALLGSAAPNSSTAAYDSAVDPSITNEFATAAFRLGHTQVSDTFRRRNDDGSMAAGGDISLKEAFFLPSYFDESTDVDVLLKGMSGQVQQRTDLRMPSALRDSMFGAPGSGGMDLFAINVQRGRDHGLPTYNDMLRSMLITPITSFAEISSNPDTVAAMSSMYASVEDIDLWVGLLAEDPMVDSALGHTLQTIVAEQFDRLMVGDRFFYLWDDDLSAAEKSMISRTTLSDVILRNTSLTHLQSNVFFVPEPSGVCCCFLAVIALLSRRRAFASR